MGKRQLLRFHDWAQSWFYYLVLHRFYYYGFTQTRELYMRLVASNERQRLGRPLEILEIGSFRGHSAILWNDYGHVTCVDPWPDPLTRAIFWRNLRLAHCQVTEIQGRSPNALWCLSKTFDLIYIDGDHSYEACLHDLKASARLLRDGGILCGDDFKPEEPGVIQAVREYLGFGYMVGGSAFYAARLMGGQWHSYAE